MRRLPLAGLALLLGCSNGNLEDRVNSSRTNSSPRESPHIRGQILESKGFDELYLGRYETALARFKEAEAVSPAIGSDYQHLTRVAVCYNALGQPDSAIAAAERALTAVSREYVQTAPMAAPYRASALAEAAQGHLARYDNARKAAELATATAYIQEARELAPDSPQLLDLYEEILSRQAP